MSFSRAMRTGFDTRQIERSITGTSKWYEMVLLLMSSLWISRYGICQISLVYTVIHIFEIREIMFFLFS